MGKPKKKFDQGDVVDINVATSLAKKKFHPHDLCSFTPATRTQELFFEKYYTNVPLIVQVGVAGSGKTACAMYAAMSEVFDESSPYDKIIIIRSAAQTREIGHLPGDADEKMAKFEAPYESLTSEMVKYGKSSYANMKALGYLEFHSSSFLRGITFNRSVVIVDEFQNMDFEELFTCLTRLGDYSKIILCGDHRQCDLKKRNDVSGYGRLMRVIDQMPYEMTAKIEYGIEDCVRSGLVRELIRADYSLDD